MNQPDPSTLAQSKESEATKLQVKIQKLSSKEDDKLLIPQDNKLSTPRLNGKEGSPIMLMKVTPEESKQNQLSSTQSGTTASQVDVQQVCMAGVALLGIGYCVIVFGRSTDSNKWLHLIVLFTVIAFCATQFQDFVRSNNDLDLKIAEMTQSYEQEEMRQKELTKIKQQQKEDEGKDQTDKRRKPSPVVDYSADKKDNSGSTNDTVSPQKHAELMKAAEDVGLSNEVCSLVSKALDKMGPLAQQPSEEKTPPEDQGILELQDLQRQASRVEEEFSGRTKENKQVAITRICLTGGPCAGKTTALATLSQVFAQMGYRVLQVPEVATILMKGNALIQTHKMTMSNAVQFQISLMKLQMSLEKIFIEIAQTSDSKVIILFDRGVMDGQAYSDPNVWQAILDETGWSTVQLRDRRYEAVIHMMTAAEGAEEFYTGENNEARYESLEEARQLDKKLINAWVGHPHFTIIKNKKKGFMAKIDYCQAKMLSFVGEPQYAGYTRKYLLAADKSNYEFDLPQGVKREHFELEETFLWKTIGESNSLRKLGKNDSFTYSHEVRYSVKGQKIERKRQITGREYIELLEQRDNGKRTVKKLRQCYIYERQYLIVETFLNIEPHPSVMRIEATSETSKIKLPPFLKVVRDVTHEDAYTTSFMADKNYVMPENDQDAVQKALRAKRELADKAYQEEVKQQDIKRSDGASDSPDSPHKKQKAESFDETHISKIEPIFETNTETQRRMTDELE